jgi:hypothetical protein
MRSFLFTCFITIIVAWQADAQVYVSTTGSDATGNGSSGNPYRTIVYGVQQAPAGGTVLVNGGVYNEASEVFIGKALTLQKNGTTPVIIDAINRNGPEVGKYMIGIVNTSNVTVNGLTLKNCIGNGAKAFYVLGSGNNITIQHCEIENIGWIANNLTTLPPNNGTIANAIRVEGSSALPITNISLQNNHVFNCAAGWAEAVTVTGNVDGFSITGNSVHAISNIGIVAAGNYATGAPANFNQCRNGIINGNEVFHCMSGIATSAGIYIDGAINCTVEKNRVHHNGGGISVGAEVPAPVGSNAVSGHIIRNNLVYENSIAGIFWGSSTTGNSISNSHFYNNTVYGNCTGLPVNGINEIGGTPVATVANGVAGDVLFFNSNNTTFQNNIVQTGPGRRIFVGMANQTVTAFTSNYNLFYQQDATPFCIVAGGHSFNSITGPVTYATLADFRTATGLELNSLSGNPGFSNAAMYNFIPVAGTLPIDNGNPVYNASLSGATDIAGNARAYAGVRIDVGAYEYQPVSATAVTYQFTGNGNWNVPANWSGNLVPPFVLPAGGSILIDPVAVGECILNVSQSLAPGSSLQVISGKKLRISGRLVQQ